MASPPPSEEERRLLREYRLTSVPSRHSSNASTITIASTTKLTPKLPTSSGNNSNSNGGSVNLTSKSSQKSPSNQDQNGCNNNNSVKTSSIVGNNTNATTSHHHHHGNHHNHHHHHHHHNSNHKRHKSATPTHELTPDEVSRMLELVSELNFLKLVTTLANGNTNVNENGNGSNSNSSNKSTSTAGNCINSTTNDTSSCKSYIFEKVDYIKKINIRRKAFKRFKRARNKSRVISPANTTESPKIKL